MWKETVVPPFVWNLCAGNEENNETPVGRVVGSTEIRTGHFPNSSDDA
jgi:hypothetical protein